MDRKTERQTVKQSDSIQSLSELWYNKFKYMNYHVYRMKKARQLKRQISEPKYIYQTILLLYIIYD